MKWKEIKESISNFFSKIGDFFRNLFKSNPKSNPQDEVVETECVLYKVGDKVMMARDIHSVFQKARERAEGVFQARQAELDAERQKEAEEKAAKERETAQTQELDQQLDTHCEFMLRRATLGKPIAQELL